MSRLRVVASAYACGPSDESEAGAGWAFATAAARTAEVWLLTQSRFAGEIEQALAADPELQASLHPVFVDLDPRIRRFKKRPRDVYWYYGLWQRKVARTARALHADLHFDVAHHLTFASDWLPCGLNRLREVPLVWGPVGGASYLPWRLVRWIGVRGVVGELVREGFTRLARLVFTDPVVRRAAVVVAQNPEVGRRFKAARRVVVEPNAAFTAEPVPRGEHPEVPGRLAVFVGRLIPWKGLRLGLEALARPEVSDWTLDVYGSGAERAALEAQVSELGLSGRVRFLGQRPRSEVLAAYARADAMLFPSMHDSAGWAVGEASAAGCPVVCLDLGGPPLLAGPNGHVVAPGRRVVEDLAAALAEAGKKGGTPYPRWSAARLPALVAEWYADAAASRAAGGAR